MKKIIVMIIVLFIFVLSFSYYDKGENARPPLIMCADELYIVYDSIDTINLNDYNSAKISSQCKAYEKPNINFESNMLEIGEVIYYSENDKTYIYAFSNLSNKYIRYKIYE